MLLAPAALLGVRGEVWVDADAASRCPMLTYRWIHQPGLLDLQLHSDTSVMARWSTVPGDGLHGQLVSPDMGYGGAVATTDCGYVVRLRADADEL